MKTTENQLIVGWLLGVLFSGIFAFSPMIPVLLISTFPEIQEHVDPRTLNIAKFPWLCLMTVPVAGTFLLLVTAQVCIKLPAIKKRRQTLQEIKRQINAKL